MHTVALLGGGTVGAQVARLLLEQSEDLRARVGAPLELVGVAVRDTAKPREGIPADLITSDAAGLCLKSGNVAFLRGSSTARKMEKTLAMVHWRW